MEILATLKGLRAILQNLIWNPGFPRTAWSVQKVAATLAGDVCLGDNPILVGSGAIAKARFVSNQLPGAGESMVIDLQYAPPGGGYASILTAPYTYDHTATLLVVDLPVVSTFIAPLPGRSVPIAGGSFRVSRTYVAGAPAMAGNGVFVDYYGDTSP